MTDKGIPSLEELKRLDRKGLNALSETLRRRILDIVSQTGGHLASNLGVVELTIALHRVFDSPRDKIIFDVGHQCYAHKILTGRDGQMDSLRCYQGLSGFPKCEESPHDVYETGHASTAISAALGMARARDLRGEDHRVIAVVGDGALTGGLCYEALNDAGNRKNPADCDPQ
ncbi:MAG: 1-deoxy-D-xylulose-5-phosphate synthase N-terminal domain-containing protein [Christensenellales bacterium]